jgi:WD40 repeat protein
VIILRCPRKERIDLLAFAPGGRGLAAASRAIGLKVWDGLTPDAGPSRVLDYARVRSARYTSDGRTVLLTGYSRSTVGGLVIVLHNLVTDDVVVLRPDGNRAFGSCEITPDGKFLLTTGSDTSYPVQGHISCRALDALTVPLWTAQTTRFLFGPPLVLPDGQRFALLEWDLSTPRDYLLTTRASGTGAVLGEFRYQANYREPIIASDGRWIAMRYMNRIALFHGTNFTSEPIILKNDSRKTFTALAFHPLGRYLAATSNDQTVKLYDTETWKVTKVFTWEIGRMRSVAFSPDGMLAAAGGDIGQILVWDFDL